jgi:hypothetical protein
VKHLAVRVLFAVRIGAFALGECGVEQDVEMVVVSKQVCIAVPPLAIGLSKLGKRRLAALIDQSSRSVDKIFDLLGLVGWRWTFLSARWACDRKADQ